ncbi:MAG: D-2-hydroxyacid dehydrogenase, partial [Gammaproteobacteria bacterium]|nr:D-2-hydroxyacid dehydrogenase [Gammaproteobacteria bacterium]
TSPHEVAERIINATVVLSNKIPLNGKTAVGADKLQYISVMATGTNNVDLDWAKLKGIPVSNALAYATPSVVQHTISLILALSNNLPAYITDVRSGRWQDSNVFCLLDHPIQEVAGKQLGIIGYGELGSSVAKAAAGLGLDIKISERPGIKPRADRVAFEELLATSDYISLHCPLTENNKHLINADTLMLMKPTAFLINTARGGLVDSPALLSALRDGRIAGAAIDVLDVEPAASDEPLITSLQNLLVTPHNAWGAIESRTRLVAQMKENIEGFLQGLPLRVVN